MKYLCLLALDLSKMINPAKTFHSNEYRFLCHFRNQYFIPVLFHNLYSIKYNLYPLNSFNQINLKQEHINPSDINILQGIVVDTSTIKMIKLHRDDGENENSNQFTEN